MFANLKSMVFVFYLFGSLISCQKELTEENSFGDHGGSSSGTALFSLEASSGNCSNFLAGGIFVVGIDLDTTNAVAVTVNVDSIGTYNISTAKINGIKFSGAGT